MIQKLEAINIPESIGLNMPKNASHFALETCQRGFLLGFDLADQLPHIEQSLSGANSGSGLVHYKGPEAYRVALEILCGLRSRLVGENEIVKQFKDAYQDYLGREGRNKHLITILEKLLKDSKEVRRDHLNKVGQYSYAGLTKYLLTQGFPGEDVVLFGAGNLAEDLIKVLNRKFNIYLCARNEEKADKMASTYGVKVIPWEKKNDCFTYKAAINTIGAEIILFDQLFFRNRLIHHDQSGHLFIDLGSPSVIDTHHGKKEGIIRLNDLLDLGEKLGKEKAVKVQKAHEKIQTLVVKRKEHLALSAQTL